VSNDPVPASFPREKSIRTLAHAIRNAMTEVKFGLREDPGVYRDAASFLPALTQLLADVEHQADQLLEEFFEATPKTLAGVIAKIEYRKGFYDEHTIGSALAATERAPSTAGVELLTH
jgi:hypothetical protein